MKDKELRIGISTTYDGAGMEEAAEDMEQLQELNEGGVGSAADEAAEGMEELAESTGELGEAAEEAAAQEEALRQYMELEAMTLKQLQAEMLRLAGARKQAAAAGDTAAYKKLSDEYNRCKAAAGQMTQQANIGKAAMMGQASAGMQFAQGLQSLGQQAASGSTDIAGMANQVMGLGMALQAGLGPVGLIMGGMQALQTVLVNLDLSSVTKGMEKWPRLAKALDTISVGKIRKDIAALDAEMDDFWNELETSKEQLQELGKLDKDVAVDRGAQGGFALNPKSGMIPC